MKKIFLGLVFCSFLISGAAFACEGSADPKDLANPSEENADVPNRIATSHETCLKYPESIFCN